MDGMKRCSKCDNEKELSEFNFRKDSQRYRSECIRCSSVKHKEWRNINPDKVKQIKKNIMKKIKKEGTYILKTNEKQMLIFD